jgi:hypothetical protein
MRSTDTPQHKSTQGAKKHGPFDEYKNCKTTDTNPAANNPRQNGTGNTATQVKMHHSETRDS